MVLSGPSFPNLGSFLNPSWTNSLIPVLTQSTGVLETSTVSVPLGSVEEETSDQISTNLDEYIQPLPTIVLVFHRITKLIYTSLTNVVI